MKFQLLICYYYSTCLSLIFRRFFVRFSFLPLHHSPCPNYLLLLNLKILLVQSSKFDDHVMLLQFWGESYTLKNREIQVSSLIFFQYRENLTLAKYGNWFLAKFNTRKRSENKVIQLYNHIWLTKRCEKSLLNFNFFYGNKEEVTN